MPAGGRPHRSRAGDGCAHAAGRPQRAAARTAKPRMSPSRSPFPRCGGGGRKRWPWWRAAGPRPASQVAGARSPGPPRSSCRSRWTPGAGGGSAQRSARSGTTPAGQRGLAANVTGPGGTSAGPVLADAFAALGTPPTAAFAGIGFTVAPGVLIDTFVVRSALVTSLFLDVGPKVWRPRRPARERGGEVREPDVGSRIR
ncbi:MMPL family transporter [Streptomyces pimonensis]|uniref:MMPL family transporter n=1 Tax=Streptomyces pimonensis TaxID=2860288 RepID=A0ABV4J2B8_9ACTN